MSPSRLALFDCDGTLASSHVLILEALVKAFGDCGFAIPAELALKDIMCLSFADALKAMDGDLTGDQLALVEQRWHAHLRNARAGHGIVEPLFPGINEALETLHSAGWLMSVATGKGRHGLTRLLETNGIKQYFTSLHTPDECASKPAPEMVEQALALANVSRANCIVIGDTEYDARMARNAGVKMLGVAWGYHSPDALLAAGALAIVPAPQDLPAYLEKYLPCN